jgi:uncharacterized protein with LGFP repeats
VFKRTVVGLIWGALSVASADTLVLANGNTLTGTFISGTENEIRFRMPNGRVRRFALTEVQSLDFDRGLGQTQSGANRSVFPDAAANSNSGGTSRPSARRAGNEIQRKYQQINGARFLGSPASELTPTPDGTGYFTHYSNNASIYWSPETGAHEVHGAIRDKWIQTGWERGALGFPTSDEQTASDGRGKFNTFERGAIYYTPETGANLILGPIRDRWVSMGAERSALGYPVKDDRVAPDGVSHIQEFQRGTLVWDAGSGQVRQTR